MINTNQKVRTPLGEGVVQGNVVSALQSGQVVKEAVLGETITLPAEQPQWPYPNYLTPRTTFPREVGEALPATLPDHVDPEYVRGRTSGRLIEEADWPYPEFEGMDVKKLLFRPEGD